MRTISAIDKDINSNRRRPDWKRGDAREIELFRERGFAQLERDEKADAALRRAATRPLPKRKCPTCGAMSYA